MEDFIREIYTESNILTKVKGVIDAYMLGNLLSAEEEWKVVLPSLVDICNKYEDDHAGEGQKLFSYVKDANDNIGNFPYIEDVINNKIIPSLFTYLEKYTGIDVKEATYQLLSSRSGMLTINDFVSGKMIHSKDDPVWEAKKKADAIYKPHMTKFFVCGVGLGYLAKALFDRSMETLDIYVLEPTAYMVDFAKIYGVLDEIPSEKLHIYSSADQVQAFSDWFFEMEKAGDDCIGTRIEDYASSHFIPEIRDIIKNVRSQVCVAQMMEKMEEVNFYQNINHISGSVYELEDDIKGKECIVVAAGPSLDDSIDFLKESAGNRKILVVSTVAKKLQDLGISYDYMLVMDPQDRTYGHMMEADSYAPIIISPSAAWRFAANNKGKVYLAPKNGRYYSDKYLREKGEKLWPVYGTVTNLALYTALEFGASSVYLVGVDLSFPNGMSHATDTMDLEKVDESKLFEVKSNLGNPVYTDDIFINYIKQMEDLLEKFKDKKISVYNLSKDGAYIKGTKFVQMNYIGK